MEANFHILVVDDEPIGRQLLEAVLFPEGYDISFAENGMEAFNKTLAEKPDLVMLDVMMPQMDGFETCKKIRETKDIANVPVFLITALDDRDSRIRGLDAGADDYISKPFDRIEILAKVKNIKQNRKVVVNDAQEVDAQGDDLLKIQPLVFNSKKMLSFFKEDGMFLSVSDKSCSNCAISSGYTNNGKYLAFFGNSFDNDVAKQLNLHLAIAIQFAFLDVPKTAAIDAILSNIKTLDINISEIGFYLVLINSDNASDEYKISGVNSSFFIKSQSYLKSAIIPGTNLSVNKNTHIAICSNDLLNKINEEELGAKIVDLESAAINFNSFSKEYDLNESAAIAIL